jgi:putative phage-type endonuclease
MIYDEKIYQDMLARCACISTDGMSNSDWLELRKTYIGGSDVGPIMELSDYGSKFTVYAQKKGLVDVSAESPAAHRGKLLEKYIREMTAEKFPELEIATVPYILLSKEETFRGANVDGVILPPREKAIIIEGMELEGLGGHEIKSSKTGYGFGKEEVPDAYFAQVQHYMDVLDLPWFLLSVFIIENDEVRHYPIMKNPDFIKDMRNQEADFWNNYYLTDTMPAAIGIDNEEEMIASMFNGSETIVLGEAERNLCADYVELNKQAKEIEDRKKAIKLNLMETIVQKSKGQPKERKGAAIAGPFSVSWITVERKDPDRDAMRQAGIYEQYAKVTTYDRITVTQKKGA